MIERMSEQETEQKHIETVNITLTVKLPKPWLPVLQGLSDLLGLSIDVILLDGLYSTLSNFFWGGHFDAWMEYAAEKHGLTKARTEQLEEMIEQMVP
jgi:hypothetical protein